MKPTKASESYITYMYPIENLTHDIYFKHANIIVTIRIDSILIPI